jgi:hypothetical protein
MEVIMIFYHGTSNTLQIDKILLPPYITYTKREEWRNKFDDKVFITNSIKSAIMYAKKACQKYGGKPVVYQVEPKGCVLNMGNAEYICDKAIIIGEKIYE